MQVGEPPKLSGKYRNIISFDNSQHHLQTILCGGTTVSVCCESGSHVLLWHIAAQITFPLTIFKEGAENVFLQLKDIFKSNKHVVHCLSKALSDRK